MQRTTRVKQNSPRRVRPLPLDFHKVVDARRRSRIDRARQLSMNVEMQKHILHTTEIYNLESERQRLKAALATSLGAPLARVVHDAQMDAVMRTPADEAREAQRTAVEARLAQMTNRVVELEAAAAVPMMPVRRRVRRKPPEGTGESVVTFNRYAR